MARSLSKNKNIRTSNKAVQDENEFRERERKFVLPFEERSSEGYRKIYTRAKRSVKKFPSFSSLKGCFSRADGTQQKTRRGGNDKEIRIRNYYADLKLLLYKANLELRCEQNKLIIKKGNGANSCKHTLDRYERKVPLINGIIRKLSDVWKNAVEPRNLAKIFNDISGLRGNTKLYAMVRTESEREKFEYFKFVDFKDKNGRMRKLAVELEFACDIGTAYPAIGEDYDIDQIELEVKRIIDVETQTNILEHPDAIGVTPEAINDNIVELVLDREEALLKAEYCLETVYDSKPAQGFHQIAKALEGSDDDKLKGHENAIKEKSRENQRSVWSQTELPISDFGIAA